MYSYNHELTLHEITSVIVRLVVMLKKNPMISYHDACAQFRGVYKIEIAYPRMRHLMEICRYIAREQKREYKV